MSLTVWTNHELRPGARALFAEGLAAAGARLIQSAQSSRSVLDQGEPDPTLGEADIAYGQPDPDDVMRHPRLKWIAISTAGYTRYDRTDFRAAMRARGTVVTNASGVFATPCAEHLLAMMLALGRQLPKYVLNQAGPHGWPYLDDRYAMTLLTGQTVVILGYGAIGKRLAELLAPFRGRVIAVRRAPRGDEGVETVTTENAAAALAAADHVVNVLPDNPVSRGWCNAARFAQMKRGARFYNVGRGTSVNQPDLVAALQSGQVGGAYLDALDPEPLPPEHPIWTAPNCHITQHIGGGSREQDEALVRHFLENFRRFRVGEAMVDRIG
ncbi:MAG: D-2-hydroxyacid dehydrogenase [Opitutae bacterium]|nr:D-2-hydroxyacid dehydrogenase [Opitutae bacterium]